MELKVINESGQSTSALNASDALFGRDYNESLIHQIVNAFLANRRQGTRAQKARGDLTRSHKKPWRQKGTGRARSGYAGSPIWRGGGRVFPSSPDENFSQKINRKMYRAGISSILSQLVREDRLLVVESFSVDAPKTKVLSDKFKSLGLQSALVITDAQDDNLYLSSRNLAQFDVVEAGKTDPVRLLQYEKVVVTKAAIAKLEEVLS
ncbi:MAG: 50S ribosomal protein L4 [Betaproteobacteria bacterium]|jgi:large subunit ribosomal protein L4